MTPCSSSMGLESALPGGNAGAGNCPPSAAPPGTYAFCVGRLDGARVTGSGELVLIRLKPRAGVTSGTTRIELDRIASNEAAPPEISFMTNLLLLPYVPSPNGNTIQNAYGATITIRPGS